MRLIDADELRKSIRESLDECVKWADEVEESEMYARVSQSIGTFVECSLRIKNAPTVCDIEQIRAEIQENINYNKKMNYQGIVAGLLLTLDIIDKYMKGE